MGSMVWKVLSRAVPLAAGIAATKAADVAWRTAGNEKVDPADPAAPGRQAVAYAALTGLAVGIAKTWASRKAVAYYANSTGHLPKELQKQRGEVVKDRVKDAVTA